MFQTRLEIQQDGHVRRNDPPMRHDIQKEERGQTAG